MEPQDDHGDSVTDATPLALGQTVTGLIGAVGDRDVFAVDMAAAETYQISLVPTIGLGFGSLTNEEVRVVRGNGDLLDFTFSNGLLKFAPPVSGTYFIDVGDQQNDGTGYYQISYSLIGDEAGNSFGAATTLSVLDQVFGALNFAGDEDWWRTTVSTNRLYMTELRANKNSDQFPNDMRVEVYDSVGNLLTAGDTVTADEFNNKVFYTTGLNTHLRHRVFDATNDDGSYQFSVVPVDLYSHSVGDTESMYVSYQGGIDMVEVQLQAGMTYGFQASFNSSGEPPHSGMAMSVFGQSNGIPGEALLIEHRGAITDRAITFSVQETGVYYVGLEGPIGSESGWFDFTSSTLAGAGNDDVTIPGSTQAAFLAWAGDDVVRGTGFADIINGGEGADELSGFGGGDKLRGGVGADMAWGHAGNDEINGGAGADRAWGGAGADVINGGGGNDFAWGGTGADELRGLGGADRLMGQGGADKIWGGGGGDRLDGGGGGDRLEGNAGRDALFGNGGRDMLFGGGGADSLNGGGGNDVVRGGGGNDKLRGGAGIDALFGEGGRDMFQFARGDGRVTIKDLTAIDDIDLIGFRGTDKSVLSGGDDVGRHFVLQIGRDVLTIERTHYDDLADMGLVFADNGGGGGGGGGNGGGGGPVDPGGGGN